MLDYILIYLFLINMVAFLSMYIDKQRAINHKWRIKETTLLGLAILGGSIGSYLGLKTFKHKTKHIKFTLGIPTILGIQIIGVILFLYK